MEPGPTSPHSTLHTAATLPPQLKQHHRLHQATGMYSVLSTHAPKPAPAQNSQHTCNVQHRMQKVQPSCIGLRLEAMPYGHIPTFFFHTGPTS